MRLAQLLCGVVLGVAAISSCLIQVVVQSQVNSRLYGSQRIRWIGDLRWVGVWFGKEGLWNLHQRYYPASRLRFWFAVSFAAVVLAIAFRIFLQVHGVR